MDDTDATARREPEPELERRLTALEVKACYADDLLDALNAQVARQQDQIAALQREVARLREASAAAAPDAAWRSPRDEIPPHY